MSRSSSLAIVSSAFTVVNETKHEEWQYPTLPRHEQPACISGFPSSSGPSSWQIQHIFASETPLSMLLWFFHKGAAGLRVSRRRRSDGTSVARVFSTATGRFFVTGLAPPNAERNGSWWISSETAVAAMANWNMNMKRHDEKLPWQQDGVTTIYVRLCHTLLECEHVTKKTARNWKHSWENLIGSGIMPRYLDIHGSE